LTIFLCIKLDDYVAKMISCHKLKGFVQTGSFRHIHIERNETNPRPRPIAAAINPPQDQSKSSMAIITKMCVHIEFMEVQGRGTPSIIVTADRGVQLGESKAIFRAVVVVIMEGFYGAINGFVCRYVEPFKNHIVAS
jgi:hypothetical protein